MKTRFIIGMAMVGLALTVWAFPGWSNDSAVEQQKSYYIKCISDEIENNTCKVMFISSRSKNLQAYGENAALKVAFLSKNREALLQEMVAQKVSLNPHAVHQYLLQRFNQMTDTAVAKKGS